MAVSKDITVLPRSNDTDVVEDVEAELARILAHAQFKDTTRLKRFLTYVVEEALEGRSNRLKGYSIGLEVFDRPESFDPQADTIVRVQAGQLRRRLDLYYSKEGQSSTMRILLPKGSYVPVFERRQISLPAPDDMGAPQSQPKGPLKVGGTRPRIYVPTFTDLSSTEDKTHFAQGLTAEVINALVQFRYLRIIAGTGTIANSDDLTLNEIKDRLAADFVLSGTVRRQKDLVRVSINLLSTDTGEHVFAKIFDRECTPENLFEIQESIASYTAANVGAPFGAVNRYNRRQPKGLGGNMNGYHALLKFYNLRLSMTEDSPRQLLEEFKAIAKEAPQFSSGWAAQSLLHTFFVGQIASNIDVSGHLEEALRCARKAVTTDPENSLAFFAQFMAAYHAGDFERYEASAQRSLALNPNDYNSLIHYALTLAIKGKTELARAYAASARELIASPPLWFSAVDVICAFVEEDYDTVLSLTATVSPASVFGLTFYRIAAGRLAGRMDEVQSLHDAIVKAHPTVFEDAFETLKAWHPTPHISSLVKRGWEKP